MSDSPDPSVLAAKVLARATAGLPAGVAVCDGVIPDTPTGPYVVLMNVEITSLSQRYSQTRPNYHGNFSWLVVNNSPDGVRKMGAKLHALFDDLNKATPPTDGLFSWPDYNSGLITDDSIEGAWKHSDTHYFNGRTE